MDAVLISGLLRLRLIMAGGRVPLMMRDWWSSISSGDPKMVAPWESPSVFMHCEFVDWSAVTKVGSIGMSGDVWLRGRFILWADGRRD